MFRSLPVIATIIFSVFFGIVISAHMAGASNCSGYPYTFSPGQTAASAQVNANFANILSCANANLAHNGVNSDITQLTAVTNLATSGANSNITSLSGLTTPLSVAQGGTGSATASGARTNLGLGTAAVENLLSSVADCGGSLCVGSSGVTAGSYTFASITVGSDGRLTAASSGSAPASAATATQMEGGSDNTAYATANNVQYSPNAVKAFVLFTYSGSSISIQASRNVSAVSRSGTGTFNVQLSGGLTYAKGGIICSAENAAGPNPLECAGETIFSGTNPNPAVDFYQPGVGFSDPAVVSLQIIGTTTN